MRISKVFLDKSYPPTDLKDIIVYLFRNKELSDTPKSQYAQKLPQWISYLPEGIPKTLNGLLSNPEQSINALEATNKIKHSPANHHIYISSAVAFIKYIVKDTTLLGLWKRHEQTNWEPLAEHYDENKPTDLQEDKRIRFETLISTRLELEKGSQERLLLAFYTLIEPIRADYYATEIVGDMRESKEKNYIILTPTSARLVVEDFKTKRKYMKIENTLSGELQDELRASLEKEPRRYLFVMDDKESPYTRKLFSNWACRTLSRILKQPMTLTALRHIYITQKIKENTSPKEMKDIARKMGHSRGIQRVYEWSEHPVLRETT